jgi:hypothetical protein
MSTISDSLACEKGRHSLKIPASFRLRFGYGGQVRARLGALLLILLMPAAVRSEPLPLAPARIDPPPPARIPGDLAAEVAACPVFFVAEIPFTGPTCGPTDAPARTVEFWVRFRHESGSPTFKVHGFWDGDGQGRASGSVFKVRFCPTAPGRWTLDEVHSSAGELNGQKQGDYVTATVSTARGFWLPDPAAGGRWYRRTDGSHPYIIGITHLTFLSGRTAEGQFESSAATDIAADAKFFNKVRFSVHGDRYPHPTEKPFLDNTGHAAESGDYSHRPNPSWFRNRVDVAVRAAFERDMIADLVLAGPLSGDARSTLRAAENTEDPTPYLRYIAARYGSYPNVWLCLATEFDGQAPRYTAVEMRRYGAILRSFLPYSTPLSVAGRAGDWNYLVGSAPPWNDHAIVEAPEAVRSLATAADFLSTNEIKAGGRMPIFAEPILYEGPADRAAKADVLEATLGALAGGGYVSTGYKEGTARGSYFWGRFSPNEMTSATSLAWLRQKLDKNVEFWKMTPVDPEKSIFRKAGPGARAMEWADNEYLLAVSGPQTDVLARLPRGGWRATCYDLMTMEEVSLGATVSGLVSFDVPASRAVLFHFKRILPAVPEAPKPTSTPTATGAVAPTPTGTAAPAPRQ